jgi:predicted DNA-binding protein (UPF0251 family)
MRPQLKRKIHAEPVSKIFAPLHLDIECLEPVKMSLDEYEAIRLSDYEGLFQIDCAEKMSVSRQTFGRILSRARAKLAKHIVECRELHIDGGDVVRCGIIYVCESCKAEKSIMEEEVFSLTCPICGGKMIKKECDKIKGKQRGRKDDKIENT